MERIPKLSVCISVKEDLQNLILGIFSCKFPNRTQAKYPCSQTESNDSWARYVWTVQLFLSGQVTWLTKCCSYICILRTREANQRHCWSTKQWGGCSIPAFFFFNKAVGSRGVLVIYSQNSSCWCSYWHASCFWAAVVFWKTLDETFSEEGWSLLL